MHSSPSQHDAQSQKPEPASDDAQARKTHEGSPRPLGFQTNLGDQEELEGVRDPFGDEEPTTTSEHDEEQAHSNTTTHHASRRTRAGERDPFGSQGQY